MNGETLVTLNEGKTIIPFLVDDEELSCNLIVLEKQQVGSRSGGQAGLVVGLADGLVESQCQILLLIVENLHISKRELAERIGISIAAIDNNIKTLKNRGVLRRVGPDKGGYWEVVDGSHE